MKILVTRPQKQAATTAEKLKERGHQPIVEPLLTIQPTDAQFPEGEFGSIVLTSGNSLDRLDRTWPLEDRERTPVLVTGEATQSAAKKMGFLNTRSVDGSAVDLIAAVPGWQDQHRELSNARILYPCAETVAHDITAELSARKLECISWPVYRSIPSRVLSKNTAKMFVTGEIDLVLLYSARTARTFSSLIEKLNVDLSGIKTLAISNEVKQSLPSVFQTKCIFPRKPNEEALLELIDS